MIPEWLKPYLNFQDPLVQRFALAAAGIVALALVLRIIQRRREAAAWRSQRERLRETYGQIQLQQQEVERLALQIIATSSSRTIAGFALLRQIEAVFTDGHQTPGKAVEMLKALAAQKGANAIINLHSDRLPTGKCMAQGDAVVVKAPSRPA